MRTNNEEFRPITLRSTSAPRERNALDARVTLAFSRRALGREKRKKGAEARGRRKKVPQPFEKGKRGMRKTMTIIFYKKSHFQKTKETTRKGEVKKESKTIWPH